MASTMSTSQFVLDSLAHDAMTYDKPRAVERCDYVRFLNHVNITHQVVSKEIN